jgi:hypothetical protein
MVTDLSLGERGFRMIRRKINEVQPHPAAVLGVVVATGAVMAIAAAVANASAIPGVTFTFWVSLASAGFGLPVQLGLVVAALLLVLDSSSGAAYRGQRPLFGVLVAVSGAGMGIDLLALIVVLAQDGAPPVGAARLVASWVALSCSYLAPVSLGALACLLGAHGARSLPSKEEPL